MIALRPPDGQLSILALGAHPDDVEIGCGGSLLTLVQQRAARCHVVLLGGTTERAQEASHASRLFIGDASESLTILGFPDGRLPAFWNEVKQELEDLAPRMHPDVVFAPRRDDAHQDHRMLGELATTVWRDALVLHYEIPKWDGDLGQVNHYVPFDRETAQRKVDLLRTAYPSQVHRDWWDDETFFGLMRLRGVECRSPYAEGFVVRKAVLNWR